MKKNIKEPEDQIRDLQREAWIKQTSKEDIVKSYQKTVFYLKIAIGIYLILAIVLAISLIDQTVKAQNAELYDQISDKIADNYCSEVGAGSLVYTRYSPVNGKGIIFCDAGIISFGGGA